MGVIAILLFILFLVLPGLLAPDHQETNSKIAQMHRTDIQIFSLETRRDPVDREKALWRLYKDRGYDTSVPKASDLDAMHQADIALRLRGIEPEPVNYNVTKEFESLKRLR